MNDVHSQRETPEAIAQLWGLPSRRSRGPRARLSVEQLAEAGIGIADSDGLEALTLAEVAKQVGLTTTALYRYVDSKATLVEVMIDRALGDPPRLTARGWRRRVDQWVVALWSRYTSHPWLAAVQPSGPPRSPAALAWMNLLVGELRRAERTDPLNDALALDVLVRGFATLEANAAAAASAPPWLIEQIADRYPELTAQRDDRGVSEELNTAVASLLG